MRKVSGLLAAAAVVMVIAACESKSSTFTEVVVNIDTTRGVGHDGDTIIMVPHEATCDVGQTVSFPVFTHNGPRGDNSFSVSSSTPTVATVSQSDAGAVAKCLAPGKDTITATMNADATAHVASYLTVNAPPVQADTSLVLAKLADTIRVKGQDGKCANDSTIVGDTVFVNGVRANIPVSFSTSDPSTGTVSSAGVVTGFKNGTVTITVKVGSVSKQETIVIITCPPPPPPPPPSGTISVTPPSLSLQFGVSCTSAPATLVATVTPSGTSVSWSSSDNNVITVSSTGVVTTKGVGSASITASITVSGVTKTFTVTATVVSCVPPPPPPSGASISVSPTTLSLQYGTGCTSPNSPITPKVSPDGTVITWTSSNTAVATAPGGIVVVQGVGSATITASVTGADGVTHSATTTVTVVACTVPTQKPILVATPINGVFHFGSGCVAQTYQLLYHLQNPDGSTVSQPVVTTSVAPAGVVTVNSTGLLTTVAPGDAIITLKLASDNTVTASVAAHVDNQNCGSGNQYQITLDPPTGSSCNVNGTISLKATVKPDANGTWTVSNSNVGFVNSTGVYTGTFQCLSPGTDEVCFVVNSTNNGCQTYTVNAIPQTKPYVVVTGPSTIALGSGSQQFSAVVRDSVTNQPVTNQAGSWYSLDATIVAINSQSGLATAIYHGQTQVCFQWSVDSSVKGCKAVNVP
jgi:large repetitive protein